MKARASTSTESWNRCSSASWARSASVKAAANPYPSDAPSDADRPSASSSGRSASPARAQRLTDEHGDGQRVAGGVAQQRPPVLHVADVMSVQLGDGLGELDALAHRHRRQRDPPGQLAQPALLFPAGGQQYPRLGASQVAEEVGQLCLLLGRPRRRGAGGESGDRFDVVPDPQDRYLGHHLERDRPADVVVVDRVPLDLVGVQQRLEHRGPLVEQPRQRRVVLQRGEDHHAVPEAVVGQPTGAGVPAGELHRRGRLATARVGVQQHDAVPVEGPVQGQ